MPLVPVFIFVRREFISEIGAASDVPGVLAPFFTGDVAPPSLPSVLSS